MRRFSWRERLLVKAEALRFVEVFSGFVRGNIIDGGTGCFGRAQIRTKKADQSLLPDMHGHLARFGFEFPRQAAIGAPVEQDRDFTLVDFIGCLAADLHRAIITGFLAENSVKRHRSETQRDHEQDNRTDDQAGSFVPVLLHVTAAS